MKRYNPTEIEPKWQQIWDENGVYVADLDSDKKKYYAMSMFNYPSGAGIHIGHSMNYTISDVMARFKRQQGYESYHPVGWDAFGLPAENFAIKTGVSPQESMAKIIPSYHKQYKAMGWSNDWSKEIATHEPQYYRWTQWIFAQMFKVGLAYRDSRMQWWCDIDKTVLSNEQVVDGKCWRHDGPDDPLVEKKEIKQWFFKITDYADELLEATDGLDWTESVKLAQKNWIGRSQGAEIDFELAFDDEKLNENRDEDGKKAHLRVFTTRPDTLYGATFLVVAPEHPWVELALGHGDILTNNDEVASYVSEANKKSELERMETKEKTGVQLQGVNAINPATGEKIPVWTADYVLGGYGTGAIMAVPAHDERDFEFAKKFGLTITPVIEGEFGETAADEKRKNAIIAVVRNPKDGKVLILDWGERKGNTGGKMFIGGGMEEGEDPVEAAIREIAEETGYSNVKHIGSAETWVNNHFYSNVKDKHMYVRFAPLLFELVNETQIERNLDDNEDQFKVTWVDEEKLAETVEEPAHFHGYELLTQNFPYKSEGMMINSGEFDGLPSFEVRDKMVEWLERLHIGESKTIYKIRDWSVSRQRYWGAPIPIINCPTDGPVLVPDAELPVVLPELKDFAPAGDGRSALARATDWLHVTCPQCGGEAERETDTLDTYICSSWYFLRYLAPHDTEHIFETATANKWMPVDFYNGGDHATAHMIYARFVTRFLHKLGLVEDPEPFKRFLFNGKVTASDGQMFSKSKGNGVDPLEIISSGYGADALRTYLMFAAPLDLWIRWDQQGVPATYRFLNRIWTLVQEFLEATPGEKSEAPLRIIHPAIFKVTHDIEEQKYNTAIAAMMKATNELYELKAQDNFGDRDSWQFALESLVALVGPFAPHISDELWQQLGHETSVQRDSWPQWQDEYLVGDTMLIVVQVNGKVRAKLDVDRDSSAEDIQAQALAHEHVQTFTAGNDPKKVIYIPGKIVNIVV